MKNIYNYLLLLFLIVGLNACSPYEEDASSQGDIIKKEDIKVSIQEDSEKSNLFHFKIENQGIGVFKCAELGIDVRANQFSQQILWGGNYDMTVQVYNKAGLSDTIIVPFVVKSNDPSLCENTLLTSLTGGCNTPNGKIWKLRTGADACIQLTSTENGDVWWEINQSNLLVAAAYDDELTFKMDGASVILDNHGNSYMNEGTASLFTDGNSDQSFVTANYTPSSDAKWNIKTTNGVNYLMLTNVFPMYAINPSQMQSANYEIVEITDNLLHIKYVSGDSSWHYYLVPKV